MQLRLLAAVVLACAACAEEPPPAHAVAPFGPADGSEYDAGAVSSQTVPLRYETRRIGAETTGATRWLGRPIDLDVKDAELHDVIRLLADVGHANIVVGDDVLGRVTVKLKQVPWDQALDVIAHAKGLVVEHDGNVVLVTRAKP